MIFIFSGWLAVLVLLFLLFRAGGVWTIIAFVGSFFATIGGILLLLLALR